MFRHMQTPFPLHPEVRIGLNMAGALAEAAQYGTRYAVKALRPRRRGLFKTLRPGPHTPLWNACVIAFRRELKPLGSKVRLARYLGIPKQRLNDFLTGRNRMPDAELTLQMLHWLSARRAGKDPSL